jgi:hypothetical protein
MLRTRLAIATLAGLLAVSIANAEERASGGRSPGRAVKETTRDIGHATRDVARSIGHTTRDVTRSIGHAFRDLAKKLTE